MSDALMGLNIAVNAIIAVGMVWLARWTRQVARDLVTSDDRRTSGVELSDAQFLEALRRIETEVHDSKTAAAKTARRIDVGVELGYQNAESQKRSEAHAAVVADDLTATHARADAADNTVPGSAADAGLRSGTKTPTEEP